jgi:hypothetical protein
MEGTGKWLVAIDSLHMTMTSQSREPMWESVMTIDSDRFRMVLCGGNSAPSQEA